MNPASITQSVRNVRRLAEIFSTAARHGFGEVLVRFHLYHLIPVRLAGVLRKKSGREKPLAPRGERLRALLEDLGPTFVKMGQVLSTRPDLVPPDICHELETLQDHVPPAKFEEMRSVFKAEFGCEPEECFATLEHEPVASASISQVHRARLADGTLVAVKIQRPGIQQMIRSDIDLLKGLAHWIVDHGIQIPGFDPVATVNEFARSIKRELDFSHEARMLERFARNFKDDPKMYVPRLYEDLSTPRVLTMEWINGVPMRDMDELQQRGHDLKLLADRGLATTLDQVFEYGLFHADPHPGNIFVLPGDVICLLDYGMVGQLMEQDVERIADFLLAVIRRDAEQAAEQAFALTDSTGEVDRRAVVRELHEFIEFDAERLVEGLAFGEALNRLITMLREQHLSLPARYVLLIKALATIEQVGKNLNPELDIVGQVKPRVEKLLRRRHSFKRIMGDFYTALSDFGQLGKTLPGDVREIISSFRLGGFRIALRNEDVRRLTDAHERSANRVTFGMIIGSLIVGSSALMKLDTGPMLLGFPLIGLAGYMIAAILGLSMVWSMWRSRKL